MSRKNMISAAQIRGARAMLRWTRQRLSDESGVPLTTLADFEAGRTASMLTENAGKLEAALNRAGVEFINASQHRGAGLRWSAPK
jgi:transcriptional regulator with XRE-family HTH domain